MRRERKMKKTKYMAKGGKNTKYMARGGKNTKLMAKGGKPDFLDLDKDGNKKEPMKKAVSDKKSK